MHSHRGDGTITRSTDTFEDLPIGTDTEGAPRVVGVEIEFGGLDESSATDVIHETVGGTVRRSGPRRFEIEGTTIGDISVELDTAFKSRTGPLATAGLDLLRGIIPVEMVTAPVTVDQLPDVQRVADALAARGATGSREGVLLGFGVHFNPSVAAESAEAIVPIVRAFAFLEDWLRDRDPIDPSRRLLPFVDSWPRDLVDALAAEDADDLDIGDLTALYLNRSPTRNRALDLLPLLRHLNEAAVVAALGSDASSVSGRPAFHYRLPDCRINEPSWSLAREWNRWVLVERVGADADLLAQLAKEWRSYRDALMTRPPDWVATVDRLTRDLHA